MQFDTDFNYCFINKLILTKEDSILNLVQLYILNCRMEVANLQFKKPILIN